MHTTLFVRLTGCVLAAIAIGFPVAFARSEQSGSRLGTYGGIWSFGTPGMTGPGTAPNGHARQPDAMRRHGHGQGTIWPGHGFHAPGTVSGRLAFGPLGALGLSEQQVRDIDRIEENLRAEQENLSTRIREQHAILRELHAIGQTDPQRIGEAYGQIGDLQRQLAEAQGRAVNEARALLTPEQRRLLADLQHRQLAPVPGARFSHPHGLRGW